jgi:hypothetical protein
VEYRLQSAQVFVNSTEANTALVNGYYQQLLGRTPDATGLANALRFLAGGGRREDLLAGIVVSDEYYTDHGGTNAGFVRGLYHDLLGRTPAQSEVDGWVGVLAHSSRAAVVTGFLASDEYRTDLIESWYQRYLGRNADPTGLSGSLMAMQQGATQEQIQVGILTSDEYRARASTRFGEPNVAYVAALYADVLHRTPAQTELLSWLDFIIQA